MLTCRVDISDCLQEIELETRSCEELEKQRNELRRNLQQKQKILAEKQVEAVPLIKGNRRMAKAIEMPQNYATTPTQQHSPFAK